MKTLWWSRPKGEQTGVIAQARRILCPGSIDGGCSMNFSVTCTQIPWHNRVGVCVSAGACVSFSVSVDLRPSEGEDKMSYDDPM